MAEDVAGDSMAGDSAVAAIPERVGRYLVHEVIGTGAFATVYRATDERLGTHVAVKVLAENHSMNPEVRERFILEGQRLRRASGPHVVEVYDLGDTDRQQPYMVLQWADRGDLAARAAVARTRGYRPTHHDALGIAQVLTSAVGVLHRHDVVHRDLSPKNLLLRSVDQDDDRLTEEELRHHLFGEIAPGAAPRPAAGLIAADEELLLADLGMSKDLAMRPGVTVPAGTSGFAPPEQRGNSSIIDHRADIWAATALVVWLATGGPPDEAGHWRDQVVAAGWPPGVIPVLERSLAVDVEQRHPTIAAWLADLEQLLEPPAAPAPQHTGEVRPEPPGFAVPEAPVVDHYAVVPPGTAAPLHHTAASSGAPPLPGRRRRRWPAVLVALVLVAAAGGAGGAYAMDAWGSDSESAAEGISVAIEGPDEVVVGQQVTFSAQVEGASEWLWVAPDGTFHSEETLSFQPVSEGSLTVRLLATDSQGRTTEATHRAQASG